MSLVFLLSTGNFTTIDNIDEKTQKRLTAFKGHREPMFYTEEMEAAHHIHVPAHNEHRILQHHYAFAFFEDTEMQSFYRRFVRDYMRYKGIRNLLAFSVFISYTLEYQKLFLSYFEEINQHYIR